MAQVTLPTRSLSTLVLIQDTSSLTNSLHYNISMDNPGGVRRYSIKFISSSADVMQGSSYNGDTLQEGEKKKKEKRVERERERKIDDLTVDPPDFLLPDEPAGTVCTVHTVYCTR